MSKNTPYSPLFFLAALGNGGLAVTFFMYLMFMTSHPDTPIPTFTSLSQYFTSSEPNILFQGLIIFGILGIIYFAVQHLRALFWNIKQFLAFKKTDEYKNLLGTNAEVSLMALPLTFAMTINVFFIIGAVFIPGLWSVVEYLFPLALIAFATTGFFALKIFTGYMTRMLTTSNFDFVKNNNLSQMLAMFAFAMTGVGFAASAAMSHEKITVLLGLLGSIFFITITVFFGIIKIVLGFKSMLEHGISEEASPSIWILIPILTLIGITFVRQNHGIHTGFEGHGSTSTLFIMTTIIISLQIIFGVMGYKIMRHNKYFKNYIHGEKKSAGSYALICPGVALFVFGMFFIHLGLVRTGFVPKFGIAYFLLLLPLFYVKFATIKTLFKLNKKMF